MSKRRRNEPLSDEEYANGDEEPPSKRQRIENGVMDVEEYLDYKTSEEVDLVRFLNDFFWTFCILRENNIIISIFIDRLLFRG